MFTKNIEQKLSRRESVLKEYAQQLEKEKADVVDIQVKRDAAIEAGEFKKAAVIERDLAHAIDDVKYAERAIELTNENMRLKPDEIAVEWEAKKKGFTDAIDKAQAQADKEFEGFAKTLKALEAAYVALQQEAYNWDCLLKRENPVNDSNCKEIRCDVPLNFRGLVRQYSNKF